MVTLRYSDIPACLIQKYFWDWHGARCEQPIDPWELVLELEDKDLIYSTLDDEARAFLARITNGEIEYAGYTMDR